jgi:hypothetical protein
MVMEGGNGRNRFYQGVEDPQIIFITFTVRDVLRGSTYTAHKPVSPLALRFKLAYEGKWHQALTSSCFGEN